MAKNEMAKARKVNDPYEIYRNNSGWEWRVLKKYQTPEKEADNFQYARWFCAVKTPYIPDYDMGDTYVRDILMDGKKVDFDVNTLEKWREY